MSQICNAESPDRTRLCALDASHAGVHSWHEFFERERPPPDDEGRKNDTGKARFDLIPVRPLVALAELYAIGADKYEARNWERGLPPSRVFAAMQRHAWAWHNGETHDPEDGQHHMSSVAWGAFALHELEVTRPDLDDRPCRTRA